MMGGILHNAWNTANTCASELEFEAEAVVLMSPICLHLSHPSYTRTMAVTTVAKSY